MRARTALASEAAADGREAAAIRRPERGPTEACAAAIQLKVVVKQRSGASSLPCFSRLLAAGVAGGPVGAIDG